MLLLLLEEYFIYLFALIKSMALTNVEIVALLMVALGVIKIIGALFATNAYIRLEKKIFSHPKMLSTFSLILAIIVLMVLLKELTITQIFASSAFVLLLVSVWFAFFGIEIVELKASLLGKGSAKKIWWYVALWVLLMVWVLEEILTK
jgi:hypothetical protein